MNDSPLHPLIGISTYPPDGKNRFYLPRFYLDAVRLAGGIPVLIAPGETHCSQLMTRLDGLIIAGGGDVSPRLYNGQDHPKVYDVNEERDCLELALAGEALENGIPTIGICRGHQLLNVATGGTLIPHLPDVVGERIVHNREGTEPARHRIAVKPDTLLKRITGRESFEVISKHHQGIDRLGKGWNICATAEDGVVEAQELSGHRFLLAVQWHPELSLDEPVHLALFKALAEAARDFNRSRRQ